MILFRWHSLDQIAKGRLIGYTSENENFEPKNEGFGKWCSFSSPRNSQVPAVSLPGCRRERWCDDPRSSVRRGAITSATHKMTISPSVFSKNAMIYLAKLTDRNWSHKNFRIHVVGIPGNNNLPSGHFKSSGQIKKCHQPICLWNKGISLPQLPFGVRSREVALIWPALPILVENAIKKITNLTILLPRFPKGQQLGCTSLEIHRIFFYQKKKALWTFERKKWLPQIQIVSVFA